MDMHIHMDFERLKTLASNYLSIFQHRLFLGNKTVNQWRRSNPCASSGRAYENG